MKLVNINKALRKAAGLKTARFFHDRAAGLTGGILSRLASPRRLHAVSGRDSRREKAADGTPCGPAVRRADLLAKLSLASVLLLGGCTGPGMNFYQPVTGTNPDGSTFVKSVKVATFAADFVGLRRFSMNVATGDCTIEFQEGLLVSEQYAVQNKNGDIVGTLTRSVAPGIYTARVIESYGDAGKKIIDSAAAGVTGALLSAATPVVLGGGLSAIPIKP